MQYAFKSRGLKVPSAIKLLWFHILMHNEYFAHLFCHLTAGSRLQTWTSFYGVLKLLTKTHAMSAFHGLLYFLRFFLWWSRSLFIVSKLHAEDKVTVLTVSPTTTFMQMHLCFIRGNKKTLGGQFRLWSVRFRAFRFVGLINFQRQACGLLQCANDSQWQSKAR